MSATLLTAHQVQDLLGVDASTVYRMAGDGRLPAVRIGRQWRFPADAIESLLVPRFADRDRVAPDAGPPSGSAAGRGFRAPPATVVLPAGLVTAALEAIAPALGVSMVVTDLGGRAITPVVHPAPAIAARADDPKFTAACTAEWRMFAEGFELAPRLRPGRFGFLCAHSLVRYGTALVAMVLAGGIAPPGARDPGLFHLDADRREMVVNTLPRTAALLSRLVSDSHDVAAPE